MVAHLEREQIEYALIGAFALKAYGYVRATQDIDFLAKAENQDRIVAYLESIGYDTLYRSSGYSNHAHPITKLGRIDIVYVRGETAESIFRDSRPLLVLGELSLPVVSLEHLAALKVFAMKNDPNRVFREMADLKYLVSLPGSDLEVIEGYFEKYGCLEKFDELFEKKSKEK